MKIEFQMFYTTFTYNRTKNRVFYGQMSHKIKYYSVLCDIFVIFPD